MPKRDASFVRDDDLDHRPFGDTHFGEASLDRFHPEGTRASAPRDVKRHLFPDSRAGGEKKPSSLPSCHEGFFEELDPRAKVRSPRRRPLARREPTATA